MKFKMILLCLMVFLFSNKVLASNFSDVNLKTDYNSSINWMLEKGIVEGYPDGTFKPKQCVNRAEFVKLLTLTSHMPYVPERATNTFPDVRPNDWFYPYVGNAYTLSWIEGYPDGTFKPSRCVNRVEALKMAFWAFNIQQSAVNTVVNWGDVMTDAWYSSYFYTAFEKNLLPLNHVLKTKTNSGLLVDYYYPAESMSRAEVAELLYRFKYLKDNNLGTYKNTAILPYNGRVKYELVRTDIPCSEWQLDSESCSYNPQGYEVIENHYFVLLDIDNYPSLYSYLNGKNKIDFGCKLTNSKINGDIYSFVSGSLYDLFENNMIGILDFEVDTMQPERGMSNCFSLITKINSFSF